MCASGFVIRSALLLYFYSLMSQGQTGLKVLVRGGGEMASGIAHRLHQCHMDVLITEIEHPTAVRRAVAFAEAVYRGYQTVEGVKAVSVSNAEEARAQ